IFDNAPDAVIVMDSDGNVLKWNPKAEKIFGWKFNEIVGKPLHEFIIPARYQEDHKQGMKHFLSTGKGKVVNKSIEIEALHKNGAEFFVELNISAPSVVKGKYMFIAFVKDITIRKAMTQELEDKTKELSRSNAELEQFAYI